MFSCSTKSTVFVHLVCALVLFTTARAEPDPPSNPTQESVTADDGAPEQPAEHVEGNGASVIKEGTVEPLDAWEQLPANAVLPNALPANPHESRDESSDRRPSLSDFRIEDDDDANGNDEDAHPVVVRGRYITLSIKEKKRLDAARIYLRKIALAYQREQRKKLALDPRGPAEIRICTVELNNFGMPGELRRLVHGKRGPSLGKRAASLKSALLEGGCDVTGFQGLIAHDYSGANDAIEKLLEIINKDASLGSELQAFVEGAPKQSAFNGFLLKASSRIRRRSAWLHSDKVLPIGAEFKLEQFVRPPYELILDVDGMDGAPGRSVRILNFDLRKVITSKEDTEIPPRIQSAEGVRRLLYSGMELESENRPITTVVLGEVGETAVQAARYVLEGRIRLADLVGEGSCRLQANGKITCEKKPGHPQELFGLLESLQRGLSRARASMKTKPAESNSTGGALTQEIYLAQQDLSLARSANGHLASYRVGTVGIENGKSDAKLYWIELNW